MFVAGDALARLTGRPEPDALSSVGPPPCAASASATKKSFDVKLLKEGGKKNATGTQKNEFPFLGMPADSDWVL